jgi:hypothetical protein
MTTSIKGPPTVFIESARDLVGEHDFAPHSCLRKPRGRHDNLDNLATNRKIRKPLLFRVGFFSARRKRLGMLRQTQHQKKTHNHFKHRTVRHFDKLSVGSRRVNGAVFSKPAKTQLSYLSSLSGQRAPRLDDLVGNTPSRCGRRSFPWSSGKGPDDSTGT